MDDSRPRAVFRRHPVVTGIAAGSIVVIIVSGLTAWGVAAAVTASPTSSTSSLGSDLGSRSGTMSMGGSTAAPSSVPNAAGQTRGPAGTAGRLVFRATIQTIAGERWTIVTKQGETVTLAVGSSTLFGTRTAPETAATFADGDSVVIVATQDADGSPTATRIRMAPTGS